jgi:hypothetical protein
VSELTAVTRYARMCLGERFSNTTYVCSLGSMIFLRKGAPMPEHETVGERSWLRADCCPCVAERVNRVG